MDSRVADSGVSAESEAPHRVGRAGASALARLRLVVFGISPDEASFQARGFDVPDSVLRQRLEQVGRTLVAGYNDAVRIGDPDAPELEFSGVSADLRAFAVEGAAMGLAMLDLLLPWPAGRFARYVTGSARCNIYVCYVGAGLALAQTSRRLAWRLGRVDPLLKWFMVDGWGFHAGFFHPRTSIDRHARPDWLGVEAGRTFDNGLGRAIWFAKGAEIGAIATTVKGFPADRQGDIWSGIGLAAAFAGGVPREDLTRLAFEAGVHAANLGEGAALAAEARRYAGAIPPQTETACAAFCGSDADAAATIAVSALRGLRPGKSSGARYQAWRADIRARMPSPVAAQA